MEKSRLKSSLIIWNNTCCFNHLCGIKHLQGNHVVCTLNISFLFHAIDGPLLYTALILLAFGGSIGMTLLILGCALPVYKVWWPFFVVLFYILAPLPTLIAQRRIHFSGNSSHRSMELAIFITMGFLISSFALPITLARAPASHPVIQWGACYLTLAGNIFIYLTLAGFFISCEQDDNGYD